MMPAGSSRAPGITSDAPTSGQTNGRPHALTWNMGTIGKTTSRSASANTSAAAVARAWRNVERCEKRIAFGSAVVADVKHMMAAVFSSSRGQANSGDSSAMSDS